MRPKSNYAAFDVRAPSDRSLRNAIGGVCIHWALLELSVERVLSHLEEGSAVLRYNAQLGGNLAKLSKLVDLSSKLTDAQKQDLSNVIAKVREISEERHRVVHGLWGTDENGMLHSIFPNISRKAVPTKPMSVEDIRQVKLRILEVGKRLRNYVDSSSEVRILWPEISTDKPPIER